MSKEKKVCTNDIISLCILGLIGVGIVCEVIINKHNNDFVGKQIIVDNDTLRVTSYLDHDNVFHISNGTTVDRKFVKHNIIKD